ncbi:uncharacterized protein LOC114458646 [Gouania willdenowi]|uniref:uncharacterized protein LOC114458646 n=1 Tax=Gouania willdenowi TaxID=441366 RepID=UPI001055FDCF|nr:uncharacterized protein LOC114458646 [Gouania willdenowi]
MTGIKKPTGQLAPPDPPEPDPALEELKEMRDDLSTKIDSMEKAMESMRNALEKSLKTVESDIRVLKEENVKNVEKIKMLIARVEDLERKEKEKDVIITGLKIRPKSYASATRQTEEPTTEDTKSIEEQVIDYLDSKGIDNINYCQLLPKRKDARDVKITFTNVKFNHEARQKAEGNDGVYEREPDEAECKYRMEGTTTEKGKKNCEYLEQRLQDIHYTPRRRKWKTHSNRKDGRPGKNTNERHNNL